MSRLIKTILFLLLTTVLSAEEIRVDPKQYWISTNSWDTPFTAEMLIESSLTASGLSGNISGKYIEKYSQLLDKFSRDFQAAALDRNPYIQGEYILKWMHENILSSYLENQTLMENLIDTGNYNCVSSAILYLILTREAGLTSGIVETTDHAFSTVETGQGVIDVETTTPYGFNPGVKQEFIEEFKKTGFTYVPPGNYRDRKKLNDRDTIALIFQNRMSLLQKKNLHNQVIGIAIDRWTLAGTDVTRKDMNDAFRNWAAVLNNRGSYLEAFDFIENLSGKYNLMDDNRDLLYSLAYNHMITLINSESYNGAELFLNRAESFIEENDFTNLKNMIAKAKIEDLLVTGSYDESLPIIRRSYISGTISKNDWRTWITLIHQNKAFDISENSGWWDAWQYLINLPEDEKAIQSVKRSIKTAYDNWSIGIHNKFVDLYNSGKYKRAEQLLIDSLVNDPDNVIIKRDLDTVRKQVQN